MQVPTILTGHVNRSNIPCGLSKVNNDLFCFIDLKRQIVVMTPQSRVAYQSNHGGVIGKFYDIMVVMSGSTVKEYSNTIPQAVREEPQTASLDECVLPVLTVCRTVV